MQKKYYEEDISEITDFEYDMMMLELRTLESQNPEFITKDSLTQKVGGHVKEGFTKVEHEVPLQSLQDVFNFEEIFTSIKKKILFSFSLIKISVLESLILIPSIVLDNEFITSSNAFLSIIKDTF